LLLLKLKILKSHQKLELSKQLATEKVDYYVLKYKVLNLCQFMKIIL